MTAVNFFFFFKGHWQSPCTALMAGKYLLQGLCKVIVSVKESNPKWGHDIQNHSSMQKLLYDLIACTKKCHTGYKSGRKNVSFCQLRIFKIFFNIAWQSYLHNGISCWYLPIRWYLCIDTATWGPFHLLGTWINFNFSMNKWSHGQYSVGWNYLQHLQNYSICETIFINIGQ